MLQSIPKLHFFSRLYWNQMADEAYGTIEVAFGTYLTDGSKLPDGGRAFRRSLSAELMLILNNPEYVDWVQNSRADRRTVSAVGGRFISPDEVPRLMNVLNKADKLDS